MIYARFPHLAVEIAADGFLGPGLVVKRRPPLLFRVPHHICHELQPMRGNVRTTTINM